MKLSNLILSEQTVDCTFCKIINHEEPATIYYEDDKCICFKPLKSNRVVHILIVPKKHIPSINEITFDDQLLIGHLFLVVKDMAKRFKTDELGYRLIFNVGNGGRQTIPHIHLHLVGGKDDLGEWGF